MSEKAKAFILRFLKGVKMPHRTKKKKLNEKINELIVLNSLTNLRLCERESEKKLRFERFSSWKALDCSLHDTGRSCPITP